MDAPHDILEIFLQPGEFYFGDEKTRIRTLLGSCVAITLWHPQRHIGGMCHYLLPRRTAQSLEEAPSGRYADEVVRMIMNELRKSGSRPGEYQVKIFGGGQMLRHDRKARGHFNVSERNIEAGRDLLQRHGFRLHAEDLGGHGHRNIILDLWSGDVWVKKPPPRPAVSTHRARETRS